MTYSNNKFEKIFVCKNLMYFLMCSFFNIFSPGDQIASQVARVENQNVNTSNCVQGSHTLLSEYLSTANHIKDKGLFAQFYNTSTYNVENLDTYIIKMHSDLTEDSFVTKTFIVFPHIVQNDKIKLYELCKLRDKVVFAQQHIPQEDWPAGLDVFLISLREEIRIFKDNLKTLHIDTEN